MNTPLAPASAHSVPRVAETPMDALLDATPWSSAASELAFDFGQSWLDAPEPGLSPGTASLAASGDALLIRADLVDTCVRTFAQADHEPLWDLGDVFEVFLQPFGYEGYFEFEISPRGHLLQLRYPRSSSPREHGIQDYIVRARRLVDFRVSGREGGWRVALRVPVAPLLAFSADRRGEGWRVAFCRYDYDANGDHRLSSTAPLTRPDFHRMHEWHVVRVPGGFSPARPPFV
jgi:hypothetical protein